MWAHRQLPSLVVASSDSDIVGSHVVCRLSGHQCVVCCGPSHWNLKRNSISAAGSALCFHGHRLKKSWHSWGKREGRRENLHEFYKGKNERPVCDWKWRKMWCITMKDCCYSNICSLLFTSLTTQVPTKCYILIFPFKIIWIVHREGDLNCHCRATVRPK